MPVTVGWEVGSLVHLLSFYTGNQIPKAIKDLPYWGGEERQLGTWLQPLYPEQLTSLRIRASDRHLQHATDEKEVALCLHIHRTSSFSSAASKLRVIGLSSLPVRPSVNSTTYKKWVLCKPFLSQFQPLWSKVNRGEGKPQPFRWLFLVKEKTWRACHLAEHCHQQKAPVPQEKDGCPVFRRERRSRSTVARLSDLAVGVPLLPMHTYFQQSRLETRQRVKGCPAELSCARGPNSVSQEFNFMLIQYLAIVQPFWMCLLIGLIIKSIFCSEKYQKCELHQCSFSLGNPLFLSVVWPWKFCKRTVC